MNSSLLVEVDGTKFSEVRSSFFDYSSHGSEGNDFSEPTVEVTWYYRKGEVRRTMRPDQVIFVNGKLFIDTQIKQEAEDERDSDIECKPEVFGVWEPYCP